MGTGMLNKNLIIVLVMFVSSISLAQEKITIYYFGSTSCGPCNRPEVVESVKKIKEQFKVKYKEYNAKCVMICMDTEIEEGLKFVQKYGYWDEISVGSHYDNELAYISLNKTKIPGVPHIFVYLDEYEKQANSTDIIKSRTLLKEIMGGEGIVAWVKDGFKIDFKK
jgi:hypothetical protein